MNAKLLINPSTHASLGNNINGPSLIKVPEWVEAPLGRYYLYFAHHQGSHIRLAYADDIMGPYTVYAPGVLPLEHSGFPSVPLVPEEVTDEGVLGYFEKFGVDTVLPFFPPHIASPDVHIIEHAEPKQIRMYYHGQVETGHQLTRVAISTNGLAFEPQPGFLGNSYFRVFEHRGEYYALSHTGGIINRSTDGLIFEAGHAAGHPDMRHTAIRRIDDNMIQVYWSKVGDTPEHILVSDLDVSGPWASWQISNTRSVRQPEFEWEGTDLPVKASKSGFAARELHELRDPGIYEEDGRCYLLYSVRGESGIGIVEL